MLFDSTYTITYYTCFEVCWHVFVLFHYLDGNERLSVECPSNGVSCNLGMDSQWLLFIL